MTNNTPAPRTCCDGTGWTGNPYERCTTHYVLFTDDLDSDLDGEVHE